MRRNNLAKNLERIKLVNQAREEEKEKKDKEQLELKRRSDRFRAEAGIVGGVAVSLLEAPLRRKPRRRTIGEFLTPWI